MRISITFPIADSRGLLDPNETGILKHPSWLLGLNPRVGDFVHLFGPIKNRKYKDKNEALNNAFKLPDCEANRVIRFKGANNSGSPIFISNDLKTSRHFSFDSNLVGQFEVAVTNVVLKNKDQLILSALQLEEVVKHFLNLDIVVLNPNYNPSVGESENNKVYIDCKLSKLQSYLANAYCKASTSKSKYNLIKPWWVKVGMPVLFLELKKEEKIEIPKNWSHVVWKFGIFSKFKLLIGSENTIPLYIFKSVSKKDYTTSRVMRAFILGLIAQKQAFSLILENAAFYHIELGKFVDKLIHIYKLEQIDSSSPSACQVSLNDRDNFYKGTLNKLQTENYEYLIQLKKVLTLDFLTKIVEIIFASGVLTS